MMINISLKILADDLETFPHAIYFDYMLHIFFILMQACCQMRHQLRFAIFAELHDFF